MPVDDAVADRQAEPRALADLLGREEGFEHALNVLGRDARARVGDLEREAHGGPFRRVQPSPGHWPAREKRFDVVYNLLSLKNNRRIRVKVAAPS